MRWSILATVFLLAAGCAEAQPAHVSEAFERWIDELQRQGSIAREELDAGEFRFGPRTVDGTAPILKHERRDFRLMAILDLGQIGDEKAIPLLVPLLEDGNSDVRRSAALALGVLGDDSAVPGLIDIYRDREGQARQAALQTLKDLGHLALEELGARLQTKDRVVALQIWSELDPQTLPPKLSGSAARSLAGVLDDDDPKLRQSAARLLQTVPDASAAIEELVLALDDPEEGMRELAADALRGVGKAAVPELLEALRGDRSVRQRVAAASVLGDVRPATWDVGLRLLWAAHDTDTDVRSAARNALSRSPPGIIPPPLTARWGFGITDRVSDAPPPIPQDWLPLEPKVRTRVETTLRLGIEGHRSVHEVRKSLEHPSARVRQAAIWACEETGPEWREELYAGGHGGALDDADEEVRDQAIRALGRMGPESARPLGEALTHEGFHHPYRKTRLRILSILQLFGPDAAPASPHIARALADENKAVREEARRALGALKTHAVPAIPTLVELTADTDPEVADPAAKMLATLGRDLKKEGRVMWWVVPRVYWAQILALAVFLVGWFGFLSRSPPPERRLLRGLKIAGLPLVLACPLVLYMVSRPWAGGFLPESLPTVLPLPLVATLSMALCIALASLWASAGKAMVVSVKRDPIQGFRRPLMIRVKEALNISVRAPDEAVGDVRGMAPEARQPDNGAG